MSLIAVTPANGIPELDKEDLDYAEKFLVWKNGRFYQATLGFLLAPPIGFVYFQGPHDSTPATLWPDSTWEDVTSEEANLTRRCVGALAGAFFPGTPAVLSVSVASGVPTITVVSGGSGYLSGGSGTLALVVVGGCTTQMVVNANVASGVITSIATPSVAGAGYTSDAVAVYDGVAGHGDLVQRHEHITDARGGSAGTTGYICGSTGTGLGGAVTANIRDHSGSGAVRNGHETSGAWVAVKKWRRTV